MENYKKARRYAAKCGKALDIVHDAYVVWWDKTGRNLFLEQEGTVLRVIKNLIYTEYKNTTFTVRGVAYPKVTYTYDDGIWDSEVSSIKRDVNRLMNSNNTQQSLEIKEYYNSVTEKGSKLTGTRGFIYRYLAKGFTPSEIQEIEGISESLVRWYRKDIKKRLN